MDAVIYAGSHRKGGNTDRAAELLARGIREAGGTPVIKTVREAIILPCLACGFCDDASDYEGPERCVLGHNDQAWSLFEPLFTARTVLFASPIYFYHLPSMLKTWIDRGQQFWRAWNDQEPWMADLPARTAHAVLVAGRPSGDKLFEGARLTLSYFVRNFNLTLAEPLGVMGVDHPGDLVRKNGFENEILEMGRRAWTEVS
ncbi:flavodoxin family protein [Pseudodesulfovibrio cashew]|uniref:Flavodoxin family protein n=1 Tax=Pseudodesulfovibrio cashew TaxID=2678688 RepID=A0A6I6JDV6_9BACT|nr:flavodoxin family protein [Pseudodesulfovibrio cashew]QGY38612.1 flavodoxin family protein [Pseudodesulfovibrio cashew]